MSQPWYTYGITQGYGQNNEQGVDIGTPEHTAITAIYGGQVVEENYGQAGGVVGILANVPGLGRVVEYFLHLDLIQVAMGQVIQAGQEVGLSGGSTAWAGPGYRAGALHPVTNPQFSSGPHTEIGFYKQTPLFVGNSLGNPLPYLPTATGGGKGGGAFSVPFLGVLGGAFQNDGGGIPWGRIGAGALAVLLLLIGVALVARGGMHAPLVKKG